MGYINYFSSKELKDNASKIDSSVTTEATSANKVIYEKYIHSLGNGWQLKRFPVSKNSMLLVRFLFTNVFGTSFQT